MEFPLLPYPFSFLVPWIVHGQSSHVFGISFKGSPLPRPPALHARGRPRCVFFMRCQMPACHVISVLHMSSVHMPLCD